MSEDERYAAELRRQEQHWQGQFQHWQGQFQHALHSDLAAVSIGNLALKTVTLMNGGALALLLVTGALWAAAPFVWGLLASALATGVAYFYQSFVTRALFEDMAGASERSRLIVITRIVMLALAWAGYGLFAWGAIVLFII